MLGLKRPFSTIEDMNETIINNFYQVVQPGDQVYFLGDFGWDKQAVLDFLKKKPRNIHFHFISGNHDKKLFKEYVLKPYVDSFQWIKDVKINEQKITLCHYMMASWNCSHYNAWHLFGHHHVQPQADRAIGKVMDVCVDLHNFFPISFDQIKEHMDKRPNNWDLIKNRS